MYTILICPFFELLSEAVHLDTHRVDHTLQLHVLHVVLLHLVLELAVGFLHLGILIGILGTLDHVGKRAHDHVWAELFQRGRFTMV